MDDAFVGEIRIVPWNWAPYGWLLCNGQVLQPTQYQVLFAVIGNKFGGDGRTNFWLPNLQGHAVSCAGQTTGTANRAFGAAYGSESVTLTNDQMPNHTHILNAAKSDVPVTTPTAASYIGRSPTTTDKSYTKDVSPLIDMHELAISPTGAGGAHENRQPFLTMNFIICFDGEYPIKS